MNEVNLRDPAILGTVAAVAVVSAALVAFSVFRRKPTEQEIERQRRLDLVQHGRISDGTLIDISELGPDEAKRPEGMQLLIYRYEIAGVIYECSQDVTYLRDFVDIYATRIDLPASVRYDSHNPANSIVVAETWNGLRTGDYFGLRTRYNSANTPAIR